jgi:hypothetical protein
MLNKTGEDNDMTYQFLLLAVGLSCLMMSCAPWRDTYFDNGIDVLTQPNIKEKLGKPHIVNDPLLSDTTIWMYRYILTESDLDPWGIKTFGKQAGGVLSGPEGALREKIYCYVYALTFDKEAVLRKWSRELCQVPAPPNPFEQGLSGKLRPLSRVLGKLDRPA